MDPIRIRAADDLDHGFLVDSNVAMALETEQLHLDRERLAEGVAGILGDPSRGFYLIAEQRHGRVGCALVTGEASDWRNGLWWWLQSVYVRPEARRQGVFRALYRHVQDLAEARPDIIGLRLYVDADNEGAQATYARLGMARARYRMFELPLVDD